MYPAPGDPATVTFNTTADTPDAGTPPSPVTCNDTTPPGAMAPACPTPRPTRVSNNRAGANDTNPPSARLVSNWCWSSSPREITDEVITGASPFENWIL